MKTDKTMLHEGMGEGDMSEEFHNQMPMVPVITSEMMPGDPSTSIYSSQVIILAREVLIKLILYRRLFLRIIMCER